MRYLTCLAKRSEEAKKFAALVMFGLPAIVILPFALDSYARFGERRIEIDPMWSFKSKVYTNDDVAQLRREKSFTAPNGNIVHKPRLAIHFKDGTVWTPRKTIGENDPEADAKLFAFLEQRTGMSIRTVEHEDDE